VGTAHRCGVDENEPVNNKRMIVYLHGFVHDVTVGGAHL
jgi:hypothetical protein